MKVYIPDKWGDSQWGTARGYYYIFQRFAEGLPALGATVTHDPEEEVDVDLFICPPALYVKRHERSVLYTMYENADMDWNHHRELKKAPTVIVPSTWCQGFFRKYCKVQVHMVPLAIDPVFKFKKRRLQKPFRWLYVGAANYRKGLDVIEKVWAHLMDSPNMELYIKVTGGDDVPQEVTQTDKNVFVDTRRVDQSDLVDLYHSADAFLFPTAGEGFGLTLAEAMSTGLPCICTEYSGHMDFTNKNSVFYIGTDFSGARPIASGDDLAREMKRVVSNYRRALLKGRAASKDVSRLTWDNSCRGVYTILKTC